MPPESRDAVVHSVARAMHEAFVEARRRDDLINPGDAALMTWGELSPSGQHRYHVVANVMLERGQVGVPLDGDDAHLLQVRVDRYVHDLEQACEEDQGAPEGRPGTVGRLLGDRLRRLRETRFLAVPNG